MRRLSHCLYIENIFTKLCIKCVLNNHIVKCDYIIVKLHWHG